MMSRYYPHPQLGGRPINFVKLGKGKRHYWGQKGRSYGFFTSGQYIEMEDVRHKHRRIKSQIYNNEYEGNPQTLNRIATQKLHHSVKKKDQATERPHKIYTQTGVQSQQIAIQRKQMQTSTPLAHFNIKQRQKKSIQRLQDYVSNHKEESIPTVQNQYFIQNRSFLPRISERKTNTNQNQEMHQKNLSRITFGDLLQQSRIDNGSKEPVIYYRRKSRLDNPTFCNSFGYPLACHRYI